MTDIPKWALEKALAAADDVHPHYPSCPNWTADEIMGSQGGVYRYQLIVRAFARYIAEHEQPPVDPDLFEARKVAAETWYSGVADAVMLGLYDQTGDVIPMALKAIKRGRALERGE